MSVRPTVRDDLAIMAGYHSPQVDVEVRLNTNESPEPPPAAWRDALAAELSRIDWHRYPDRAATDLRQALADHHQVDPSMVFAANGSNEVLQTLLLAYGGPGRTAATFEPTYALHSHIARLTGTGVLIGERDESLALDGAEVARVLDLHPDVVFLCSPNNPTGMAEPEDVVQATIERGAADGTVVVVDEAYGQFAEWSAIDLVDDDLPLVVTRTFSKTWSMAAARLGYAIAPTWMVGALDQIVLPYHLDVAKQIAGRLALDHVEEMNDRVERLVAERERLVAALAGLPVRVWPSAANFVLFRPETGDGDAVWQGLLDRSVLVRNCASWPRLEGCLRVTIGTPHENDRFLAALTEVLAP